MASPSAAWRPWPTCSGPVGLAETNSTITRSPRRESLRPNPSPVAITRCTTDWRAAGTRNRLTKPAPAISTRSTSGEAGNAATIACASSRGLRFACFASTSATLVA